MVSRRWLETNGEDLLGLPFRKVCPAVAVKTITGLTWQSDGSPGQETGL